MYTGWDATIYVNEETTHRHSVPDALVARFILRSSFFQIARESAAREG